MARGARGSSGRKRTRSQGDTEGVAEKVADRTKEVAGQIQERASDALEAAHGQLGNLQAIVADKLEEGAESLEERGQRGPAAAGRRVVADAPLARVRGRVAGGMERTAFWLRENDLGDVTGMVDRQVRTHPLRSALIAFVVGYAMAKSMD
jgi:hypothetical protein